MDINVLPYTTRVVSLKKQSSNIGWQSSKSFKFFKIPDNPWICVFTSRIGAFTIFFHDKLFVLDPFLYIFYSVVTLGIEFLCKIRCKKQVIIFCPSPIFAIGIPTWESVTKYSSKTISWAILSEKWHFHHFTFFKCSDKFVCFLNSINLYRNLQAPLRWPKIV